MALTKKGLKIRAAMEKFYGKTQGDAVFYASENKGNIKGVTKKKKKHSYPKHGAEESGESTADKETNE